MACVKFKYQDERFVYQKLINQVNILCIAKGKDCTCTSGYRSLEKQKIINAQVLAQCNTNYQISDPNNPMYGAVRNKNGVCIAGAYGKSNHCYCLALDIQDSWFKALTNDELEKYDLIKPILPEEPWHVQLKSLMNITQTQKEQIRDSVLNGKGEYDMTVKDFQVITGLTADGIVGDKTKEKAKEMLDVCYSILGIPNYKNAEDVINDCMSSPSYWISLMGKTKYFDSFVMNIVDRLRGRR